MALFIIPLIPLVSCMSSLSSLMLFGDKIPEIGPQIEEYKPYFLGGTGSSLLSSACIFVLIIILTFYFFNSATQTFIKTS